MDRVREALVGVRYYFKLCSSYYDITAYLCICSINFNRPVKTSNTGILLLRVFMERPRYKNCSQKVLKTMIWTKMS